MTTEPTTPASHTLSCHCEAIRFRVEAPLEKLLQCNCSSCRRFGAIHWYVPGDAITLETERAHLGSYVWRFLHESHAFCVRCGTSIMRTGYPNGVVAVNAACIEGVDIFALEVERFDGHNKIPPGPGR